MRAHGRGSENKGAAKQKGGGLRKKDGWKKRVLHAPLATPLCKPMIEVLSCGVERLQNFFGGFCAKMAVKQAVSQLFDARHYVFYSTPPPLKFEIQP